MSQLAATRAQTRSSSFSLPPWAKLGILFGITSALSILAYGPIGVSTTYPRFIGLLGETVAPTWAANEPYLQKVGGFLTPESMLVVGLAIGGFVAARFGKGKATTHVPAIEPVHAAESTSGRRYLSTFTAGFLLLFGARLAGGCTSGHVISGIAQLAVSSLIFAAAVFGAGMLTARLLTPRA
jgi:uncharacterized membrane protein YedE/YeeE